MSEQIKQCPFCGSDCVDVKFFFDVWCSKCINCSAAGPEARDKSDAILLWNAAANQLAAKDAEIARLTEACDDFEGEYLRMKDQRDKARKVERKLDADYIKMTEQLCKERDEAIEHREYWRKAHEYNFRYWQREYGELLKKFNTVSAERDEARRVARRLYATNKELTYTLARQPIGDTAYIGYYTRTDPPTNRVDATESDTCA